MTLGNEDIAAELSATFDLGLPVTRKIATWIIEYGKQLEAQNQRLREALQTLGGSPKDMLEYCQEHGLLPQTGPDGLWEGHQKLPVEYSTDAGWRKLIVVDALKEGG